jgi:KRAB domain-containing zinc finger protein
MFPCQECDSVFQKAKHLRHHTETVHCTDRKYVCTECGNSYKRSSHLRRHVQNTHSNSELVCPRDDCGKRFRGPEQLRKHLRLHDSKGSHACSLCGKSFSKKRQLESHIEKLHGPFVCGNCGQSFSSRMEFRLHSRSAHDSEDTESGCPYCESFFPSTHLLREHIRTHKSFGCKICGTSFTRERALKTHFRLKHTDDPSNPVHVCGHCGVQFASQGNLTVHVRTSHFGEKPFSCDFCGKAFGHKHVLTRHLAVMHGQTSDLSPEKSPDHKRAKILCADNDKILPQLRVMSVHAGLDDSLDI